MLRQLCLDKNLRGNDLPDAWLAAAVMQLGDHLATFDADFRKLLRPGQLTVLGITTLHRTRAKTIGTLVLGNT